LKKKLKLNKKEVFANKQKIKCNLCRFLHIDDDVDGVLSVNKKRKNKEKNQRL
jgi:hypothetical protein